MHIKLIIVLFLITFEIKAATCGGNCPDDSCTNCTCGTIQNIVSIDAFCGINQKWNKQCCICIAGRLSRGNANFMRQTSTELYLGLMQIDILSAQYAKICYPPFPQICTTLENYLCADKIYNVTGWNWAPWSPSAKACGCLQEEIHEKDQHISIESGKAQDARLAID